MKTYNRRTWLNRKKSSSTSSIITFDGIVLYENKPFRDTFIKIYDCKSSVTIHKKDSESMKRFTQKIELLKSEIELFINNLKKK